MRRVLHWLSNRDSVEISQGDFAIRFSTAKRRFSFGGMTVAIGYCSVVTRRDGTYAVTIEPPASE